MNAPSEWAALRTLPLISHGDPLQTLAYRQLADPSGTVESLSRAQFLADVRQLAARLPASRHLLNACTDRYRFVVGLAAALVTRKVCLLPSTQTPEMITRLKDFAPDLFYLGDNPDDSLELPRCAYPEHRVPADPGLPVPEIPVDQLVALVFTSGSTGLPQAHPKTWGNLVRNARAGAARLGFPATAPTTLVGTVPAQHMYGFESTVLIALQSGGAFWAGRPFFPADIAQVLAYLPHPKTLVSTPFHLKNLLAAGLPLPPVDMVLSATAPLSGNLAREVESALQAPLMEIYGCTETGQLATRRTSQTADWQLLEGVQLQHLDGKCQACGGHVEQPVFLDDELELLAPGYFRLHGRSADLVNIVGKRTSLAYLNYQLNAIPGVLDGAFYMPDPDAEATAETVVRLACFVVAPTLDRKRLYQALRQRIDPVFLPRPLRFLECLPRNASGKLPRHTLAALLKETRPAGSP